MLNVIASSKEKGRRALRRFAGLLAATTDGRRLQSFNPIVP
jgi:hypothetical protein